MEEASWLPKASTQRAEMIHRRSPVTVLLHFSQVPSRLCSSAPCTFFLHVLHAMYQSVFLSVLMCCTRQRTEK